MSTLKAKPIRVWRNNLSAVIVDMIIKHNPKMKLYRKALFKTDCWVFHENGQIKFNIKWDHWYMKKLAGTGSNFFTMNYIAPNLKELLRKHGMPVDEPIKESDFPLWVNHLTRGNAMTVVKDTAKSEVVISVRGNKIHSRDYIWMGENQRTNPLRVVVDDITPLRLPMRKGV